MTFFFPVNVDDMNASQVLAACLTRSGQSKPFCEFPGDQANFVIELVQCFVRPIVQSLACKRPGYFRQPIVRTGFTVHSPINKHT